MATQQRLGVERQRVEHGARRERRELGRLRRWCRPIEVGERESRGRLEARPAVVEPVHRVHGHHRHEHRDHARDEHGDHARGCGHVQPRHDETVDDHDDRRRRERHDPTREHLRQPVDAEERAAVAHQRGQRNEQRGEDRRSRQAGRPPPQHDPQREGALERGVPAGPARGLLRREPEARGRRGRGRLEELDHQAGQAHRQGEQRGAAERTDGNGSQHEQPAEQRHRADAVLVERAHEVTLPDQPRRGRRGAQVEPRDGAVRVVLERSRPSDGGDAQYADEERADEQDPVPIEPECFRQQPEQKAEHRHDGDTQRGQRDHRYREHVAVDDEHGHHDDDQQDQEQDAQEHACGPP